MGRVRRNANTGDVFDLDSAGIALPGHVIRGLGEYAQGHGAARALYVKATDLRLATETEVEAAAHELQRHNQELNSGELDRLASELLVLAGGEEPAAWYLSFPLTEQELDALRYIASRYTSGEILLDNYDEETQTIPRSAAEEALHATEGDGGDFGTVPLAGGTLDKKIRQLWDELGL